MKKKLIIGGVVAAAVAIWLAFLLTRTRGEPSVPAVGGDAPPGWGPAEKFEPTPWYKKLSPTHRPSPADEALEGWPRGSRVVHVETEKGELVEIGILPGGEVVVPDEQTHKVTVYHKPERNVAFELRPFVGAGLATNGPGAVAGADLVKLWKVHVGLGASVSVKDKTVDAAGVLAAGLNAWRNVDVKGYGGVNIEGKRVFGGGVTIAIK